MKKKIKKRQIELRAYIDYINDHIIFQKSNNPGFISQEALEWFERDMDQIQTRLSELTTL